MPTRRLAVPLVALAVAVPALAPTSTAAGGAPAADHVVLIALDGFDAKYLDRGVRTPNIDALARRGSVTTATGVMQSITSPSWASVATGAFPERHLNTAYWYDATTDVVRGQDRRLAVETLGEALRAEGRTVASVQFFMERGKAVTLGDPEGLYTQPTGSCADRVDEAVPLLLRKRVLSGEDLVSVPRAPAYLAVYCSDLDSKGHRVGGDHPAIDRILAALDEQVGRLVRATQRAGTYGRTVFVITGDHGMTTYDRALGPYLLAAVERAGFAGEFVAAHASPAPDTDVVIVVGEGASVHLRGAARADPTAVQRLEAELDKVPHVAQVLDKKEQAELRMSPLMGELVVEPADGWTTGPTAPAAPAGRHGTTRERFVPLVLAGAGILPDTPPAAPRLVDIAPTVAYLLGERPPAGSQGRVLFEALRR